MSTSSRIGKKTSISKRSTLFGKKMKISKKATFWRERSWQTRSRNWINTRKSLETGLARELASGQGPERRQYLHEKELGPGTTPRLTCRQPRHKVRITSCQGSQELQFVAKPTLSARGRQAGCNTKHCITKARATATKEFDTEPAATALQETKAETQLARERALGQGLERRPASPRGARCLGRR